MTRCIRIVLCFFVMAVALVASAQSVKWQDLYKVKKKDTIYGIAQRYGISIDELIAANPDMQKSDYVLKKGDQLLIPYPKKAASPVSSATQVSPASASQTRRLAASGTVNVGVMLPLHNVDGDGQRMVEYYRGVLMACDSLRSQGISTNVYAWNVPIDADIKQFTTDDNARKCDLIFGPLYSKQVKPLGDFCRKHDIRLVIPFSINGGDVETNDHIFQVYQSNAQLNDAAVKAFLNRFKGCHPIFVDCNDTTSRKGAFTSALRRQLEAQGIAYNITNLKSSDQMFAKSFSATQRNVIVLNTARSPQLNSTLAKLDILRTSNPGLKISLFGYTEWLMYTHVYRDYFHKYDAYIPTAFFYNQFSSKTQGLERSYKRWFHSDMRQHLPRLAITGYDQAQFFIRGISKYRDGFTGSAQQNSYTPLQSPLKFKRINGGGLQNTSFMLVHYRTDKVIESISY